MMAESRLSMSKMSEETYDYICTGCDKKNKTLQAVKYCLQCKVYCCQSCVDMHEIFPPLAGHSFEDVGQRNQSGNQQLSVSEFPTERCRKHAGKVIDMYCQKHDEVGCCTCMAMKHNSCSEELFSVPDTIGQLFNLTDSEKTHNSLQQMMIAMTTLHESKLSRLESLQEAKTEAIDKITEYENVLKAMLHEAAEKSKKKVEEEIMKKENALLQDIHSIDVTKTKLKETDDKLTKAASNRAQKFVCSKEAEVMFKEAENEKIKQEMDDRTGAEIFFRPNLAVMDYIQGLHGIGDVLDQKKKRSNIYKVKSSRDINIRVSDDTEKCRSFGSCLTHDDKLIITDLDNKKLKRIDTSTMDVVDSCALDGRPIGICPINQTDEVCVGCRDPNKIQFVSIGDKMKPTRKINTSHPCHGIAMKDDHLYVTDEYTSLYVYDMNGTLLRTIVNKNDGNKLFSSIRHIAFNESGDKMFVCDKRKGLVCFDGAYNHLSTIKDNDLNYAAGVCTDGGGNVLVTGFRSNNVIQFNEDGKKIGVIVKQEDGLKKTLAISFHQEFNRMYVTMQYSDIMKMYELE